MAFHYAGTDEEKLILHSHPIRARTALDYEHPAPGDRYSLLIAHEHDTPALKVIDIGSPMPTPDSSPRRLERMTFSVYPLYGSGDLKLLPVAQDGDINLATTNFVPGLIHFTRDCPPGRWYTFEYKVPEKFQLASPSFLLRLYGRGKTLFRLGLPRFYYSDGTEVTGFSVWKDPMALFPDWSKTPFHTDLTSDGKVLTNALFVMNAAQGPEMLLKMKTLIPNFGIDTLGNIREALRSREWLEKNGFFLGYQNIPPGLWQEALKLDLDMLSVKPASYQKTGADLHKFNTAHPGWRTVYTKLGERFKDYGINEIMSIDCIFQQGDAEQYEPWFRGFLRGEDEGFALYNDPAGAKPHRFADYFRLVTGQTPTPEMFGFKSWNEYKITPLGQVTQIGRASCRERV